jgi:hypothetical protein
MAYKQSPFNFGAGTESSPLNKNGDPEDQKNWTGKEKSGSKEETKAFKKDRNKALRQGKFKKAANIHKDVKSSKAANKKFLDDQHEEPVRRRDLDKKGKKIYDDHNKHARKTEGSKLRQGLRRRFGSNRPK